LLQDVWGTTLRLECRGAEVMEEDERGSEDPLQLLLDAGCLLSRPLDAGSALQALAELCARRLSTWCVIDLVDADGALEQAAFAHEDATLCALGGELAARLPLRAGASHGIAGVLAGGLPEVQGPPCDPLLVASALGALRSFVVARLGAATYVSAPLTAHGRVLGAITLVSARPERAYGSSDVALAVDLGRRAALVVDNALLRERAEEAVRIREQFLSMASHELCTPLSALEMQAQSIRTHLGKQPLDLGRIGAKVDAAQRQVARLARLIHEMLDVSRIEAGRLDLELEDLGLGELIVDVAGRFGGEARRAGCPLDLRLSEGVVGRWDRSRLDQVVTNLLHNAIKYGPGKPVRISLASDGATATLTVEDEGIGIPEAAQPRIFARFERAVSPRQYGGLGVGLFIVDQIVKAHDGRIEVRSEPGKGATFVVRLPLRRDAAPRAEAAADP
jgi:signal transduction histidine kinase